MNVNTIEIAGRPVGPGHPCFVIAEAGVNHNGDLNVALQLIDAAAQAGADAVKFQSFKAEQVASATAPKAEYQLEKTDATESQLEMLRRLELSPEAHHALQARCHERGVLFMSTPFDRASADFLDEIKVPVFKVGSGEINNWPFLEHIARKRKPIILSTGMSYLSEVDEAVRLTRDAGNDQLILLHCVSNYPANPADANLQAIPVMSRAFSAPVGYSDHTLGIEVAVAAVALGACALEKHFTLDKNLLGPDHQASLEPRELGRLIEAVRLVEKAIGDGIKRPRESEASNRIIGRRSIVAVHAIEPGTVITQGMLTATRPATGIEPKYVSFLVGRMAVVQISAGQQVTFDMVR